MGRVGLVAKRWIVGPRFPHHLARKEEDMQSAVKPSRVPAERSRIQGLKADERGLPLGRVIRLVIALSMLIGLAGTALAAGDYVAYSQGTNGGPLAGVTAATQPMTVFPATKKRLRAARFVLDGKIVKRDWKAPFQYTFTPAAGQHTMRIRIRTLNGSVSVLPAATFTAQSLPPIPPPPPTNYCVDGERIVSELVVEAGTTCEFNPNASSTLHVTKGSLLVEGTLRMRPANPGVTHRIVFEGITDKWVGGGMGPMDAGDPILDSDPGLWCMRTCLLDIYGAPTTGWTRNPDTAVGWEAGDEMRVAPTGVDDLDSRPWSLGEPVPQAYPDVPAAEVANLTRNVVIGGTPGGESHVFINSYGPQTIKFARFEHVGPDCTTCVGREQDKNLLDDPIGFVLGRWGIHFHHMGAASTGSLSEGVVVAHSASRAFTAHESDGVTFRDTVAYDVAGNSYWWDSTKVAGSGNAESNHTLYDHALSLDTFGSAFKLGDQNIFLSNVILDSAAAGTEGNPNSNDNHTISGIEWPSEGNPQWTIDGFTSHNNLRNQYAWNSDRDTIEPYSDVTFYNGQRHVVQGAYGSLRVYRNLLVRGDLIDWHSVAGEAANSSFAAGFDGFDIDVLGRSEMGLLLSGSLFDGNGPERFYDGRIAGYTGPYAASGAVHDHLRQFDFVRVVTKDGTEMGPEDVNITLRSQGVASLNCTVRIQQSDGDAWRITYTGVGGPSNRTVTPIAAFAP
jgi:hypothetical protein